MLAGRFRARRTRGADGVVEEPGRIVEEPAISARRRAKHLVCRTAQWCDAADARRIAAPIAGRVMRVHFVDRTAEMHHEHSDTPVGERARF